MKLNDPFGRMERRHQMGYQAVRDTLQRNGVDTEEAALQIIRDTRKRALVCIGVVAAATALIALIFPGALLAAAAFSLLLSAWVINWTLNGGRYVRRYIKEDLGRSRDPAETGDDSDDNGPADR